MMKKFLALLMIFMCSLSLNAKVETIKVFEYPPYIYIEKGQIKGLFFEIMKESFKLGGVEANYSAVPVARLHQEFLQGKNLIWLGLKEAYADSEIYSELETVDLVKSEIALFSMKSEDIDFKKGLKNKKVGVLRGFLDEINALKKYDPKIVEVSKIDQLIKLNKVERIDYFSLEKLSLHVASISEKEIPKSNGTYLVQNVGVVFNKKNKKLISKFKSGLDKLKNSGEYKRIIQKNLNKINFQETDSVLIK